MLETGFTSSSKVKLVRQTEIAECGLACLTMIGNYHGYKVEIGTLRRKYAPSLRGASLKAIMALADKMGLMTRAVKLPLEKLQDLQMPAVLHWDMNHYVVLERVEKDKALIHNPEGSSKWIPLAEVSDHFTGVALELRPSNDFKPVKAQDKMRISQLWQRVTGLKRALFQVLILTVLLQLFELSAPYYMQLALDQTVPALDNDLLTVLALGFGLIVIINAVTYILRSFVLLVAGSSVAFGLSSNIARRLFRLPIDWFEKRHTGDILSRFQSVLPIQNLLTQGAIAALVDGAMAVITLGIMLWYNKTLTLVALIAFLLYTAVRVISFSLEREAKEESIITHGKEQTVLIETLRGMTTMRLSGHETLRHAMWQNKLTDAVNSDIHVARIGIWQATANRLIYGLENIVTIWLAVGYVIEGSGFSVGMLFAYTAYKGQFIDKGSKLVDQFMAFRMLDLHLERISDISLTDEDKSFKDSVLHEEELKGKIELKDVSYRYSPTDPLVLNAINMTIEPGEHVAITGPSGHGKSTMIKLLLGLVEPESGEVIVDGQPLQRFGYRNYHSQVSAVLQEDSLFSGSLSDNIAMFDENLDMEDVMAAAAAASIHADIMQMPMKYETLVGDMGSTLSGGQKQRILLARALYRKPRVLIMDEGTAHLDAHHEQLVNKAIGEMGITRIIIAHRQETIAQAKRVLIMANGQLMDLAKLQAMQQGHKESK